MNDCTHRRPVYSRTRVVTVTEVEEDGKTFLVIKCSCGFWFKKMCTCRHVYCLLDRKPSVDDVFPEKCKSYEVLYHTNDEFKKKCIERTETLERHNGLVIEGKLEDIRLNEG